MRKPERCQPRGQQGNAIVAELNSETISSFILVYGTLLLSLCLDDVLVLPNVPYKLSEYLDEPQSGDGDDLHALYSIIKQGFFNQHVYLSNPLHRAAYNGDTDQIYRMVERGENVHELREEGRTALQWAEEGGHTATVKVLKALQGASTFHLLVHIHSGYLQSCDACTALEVHSQYFENICRLQ